MTWPPTDEPDQPAPRYGPPPGYPPAGYAQHPTYGYPQYPGVYVPPINGMGIAGFVCGLLGLLGFWAPFFGALLGILGVVFSSFGMAHGRRHRSGSGLAIAGLVLGVIALCLGLIVTIAFVSGNYN